MRTDKKCLAQIAVGMAFYWTMLRRSYFGILLESHSQSIPNSQTYYSFFLLGLVLSIVLSAVFRQQIENLLLNKRSVIFGVSSLASLGAWLIQLCPKFDTVSVIITICSLVVLAASFTLLTFAWGLKAHGGATKQTLLAVILSFILSYGVSLLMVLPAPIPITVAVLTPFLSSALWYAKPSAPSTHFEASVQRTLTQIPRGLIVLLIAFLLVGGVMRGISYQGDINYTPSYDTFLPHATSAVFAGIIFFMMLFSQQREKLYYSIWIILAMLYFAGLFVVAFMSSDTSNFATSIFLIPGRTCLAFFLWLTLLTSVRNHNLSPVLLFNSFFLTTEVASNFLSYIAFPLLMPHLVGIASNYTSLFAAVMALMLIIASMVLLTNRAFSSGAETETTKIYDSIMAKNENRDGEENSWNVTCSALASQGGLTKREEEVMVLFSRGNSKSKIADMLYVSEGTVKTHIKSMYRKLDVHSRQELIDLIRKAK